MRTDEESVDSVGEAADPGHHCASPADASGDRRRRRSGRSSYSASDGQRQDQGDELFLNGPLDDVVKKLEGRIHELENELKKHPDAADGAKAQIKHLVGRPC